MNEVPGPLNPPRALIFWLLLAVAFSRAIAWYSFYLYDDAFITFRFAANLAEGHGLVYNIGTRVQGITTPIWGLLLATAQFIGLSIEQSARGLAIFCELAVAWLLVKQLHRERSTLAAVLAGVLFALDLYLAKTSVGGMESSLFLLMTVAAAVCYLRDRMLIATVLAALSVFVRPEGVLFAACLLVFACIERRCFLWRPVLVGILIIALGAILQFEYYGQWIPQSVRAKMTLAGTWRPVLDLALFPRRDPLQLLLTLTTMLGLPAAWRASRFVRLYSVWALALLAAWLVTGAHLWMWYCVPFWFFKTIVTGVALESWLEKGGWKASSERWLRPGTLALVVILGWAMLAFVLGPDKMERNVYSKIRTWAAGRDTRRQSAYGMDFGAFGYYTRMRIVDEPGLVFPQAITTYNSELKRMLLGEQPEWAFVTRYQQNIAVMRSPELADSYHPVWRVSMDGDTSLDFPLGDVPEQWHPDFILYQRVASPLSPPTESVAGLSMMTEAAEGNHP
jgi:hypothetical protein